MVTTPTLDQLVDSVRGHKMGHTERRAQRVSLVMGLRGRQSTLTKEKVEEILDEVEGRPDAPIEP